MQLVIGTWIEPEARTITQCPTSYAADWETLETRPGRYPLRCAFEGGYLFPMPYWLLVSVDAERVGGATYSGFGGNNFASQPLPVGPTPYHIQTYVYHLAALIAEGRVELFPEFARLAEDRIAFGKAHTWQALASMRDAALTEAR